MGLCLGANGGAVMCGVLSGVLVERAFAVKAFFASTIRLYVGGAAYSR